ncbi:hypothetical protein HDV06_002771 [Boothiomyces sp. JEL0866]|nr:hypothetical protein HDV06_002771 [Boothiomyces sp. JEL0866]
MDYWDANTLLAEQTPLKVTFKSQLLNYGFLVGEKHIHPGTTTSVPTWFALQIDDLIDFSIPQIFELLKEDLEASAVSVNLSKSPYLYEFCVLLSQQMSIPGVQKQCREAIKNRLKNIYDAGITNNKNEFYMSLSECEKELFELASSKKNEMRRWEGKEGKRKRVD